MICPSPQPFRKLLSSPMASTTLTASGFCGFSASLSDLPRRHCQGFPFGVCTSRSQFSPSSWKRKSTVIVRAEGINPEIRKSEDKVVDSVVVTELSKPITPYCRCWRSGTFPLCDGSHVKHNKATGDNVGPLLLKKQ